jgi:glyoxylase-like metal-dependent hydrolase (beta-lactamase superfamily II)
VSSLSRRDFLAQTSSCAAHLAIAGAAAPAILRAGWARRAFGPVVAEEKFGRLEQVAPDVWALISTPLTGDYTTVSNGGLIAGKNGVLAIEGFQQPAGAAWLAGKAKELTGQWPSHVLLTHYHSDHANGVAGYSGAGGAPTLHATTVTSGLVTERNQPADSARTTSISGALAIEASQPSTLDLGGRTVHIVPRSGHTPSDVSVELDDPSVVFAGDLVWNAMFPNFVDATPTTLAKSVAALRRTRATVYVPGHGALAKEPEVAGYVAMLQEVERAAKDAHAKGTPAKDAGAGYHLPSSLGEWFLFSPSFMERAFTAWYRELEPAAK